MDVAISVTGPRKRHGRHAVPGGVDSEARAGAMSGLFRLGAIAPPPRTLTLLALAVLFAPIGCVSTQELELAPPVSPSPEAVVLQAGEASDPAYTGLELGANESDTLEGLEVLPGARVVRVDPSSPGARAGLQAGDVMLAVQGTPVRDGDGFEALVRAAGAGRSLEVEARRDTVVFRATLTPQVVSGGEPPREVLRSDPIRSRADYRTVLVTLEGKPALAARLERVHPRSPLPAAGLETGDAVVALDGEPLTSAQDLVRRLIDERKPGAAVRLTVVRGGEALEVQVDLWRPPRVLTELTLLPLHRYEHDPRRDVTRFALLDLWLFAFFSYERQAGEVEYRILHFIRFGSGEGELR